MSTPEWRMRSARELAAESLAAVTELKTEDSVKEAFYKFVDSPLAPQFPSAHEEQEALWFFRAGHASAGLVWTREQPVQEGWYWTIFGDDYDNFEDACIRHMYLAGNGAFYFDNDGSLFPQDIHWWAGPIQQPA